MKKNGGALDDSELATILTHPTIGARMVQRLPVLDDIGPLIEAHHERIEGGAQPKGRYIDALPATVARELERI